MTSEYSIELQAENIINSKTKQYFHEVLSSYVVGNYRSAIVVLWTVTVCDLVYKLQELSSIYNDKSAEKILKKIKEKQNANPTSPEWEVELVNSIKERTSMFATYEITHLEALHKQRHLSAHPILKENLDLYHPNKETSRAMIRNTLEYVLTKPSMATNKIFDDLIKDLEEKRDLFPELNDLNEYLSSKYYKHLPDRVKEYIFKQLWKFVFKLNNDEAQKNRKINLKALLILYKQNEDLLSDYIENKKEFFSSNISLEENMNIKYFVMLCNKFPKIFLLLDDVYKTPLVERIKQKKELWARAFFMFNSPNEYLDVLKNDIELDVVVKNVKLSKEIVKFAKEHEILKDLIEIYIERYGTSRSYNDADRGFDALIEPILPYLNKDQFINLLETIEQADQVYGRGKARTDHRKIKEKCDQVCDSIDYNDYPNFLQSIEE